MVADLLVVKAQPEACVALIRHTEEELALGDHVGVQQLLADVGVRPLRRVHHRGVELFLAQEAELHQHLAEARAGLDVRVQAEVILGEADDGEVLSGWLIKNKVANSAALAAAAANEYGIPLIDISAFDLNQAPISLVSEALIEKHQALPLHLRGNQLFIGMKDPTDHELIDEKDHIRGSGGVSVVAKDVDGDGLIDLLISHVSGGFTEATTRI